MGQYLNDVCTGGGTQKELRLHDCDSDKGEGVQKFDHFADVIKTSQRPPRGWKGMSPI